MTWYFYKNKKVQGYCPVERRSTVVDQVTKFAGYPLSELVIQRVKWNGKEFIKS